MDFLFPPWLFVAFALGFFASAWQAYRLANKASETEPVVASIGSLTAIICGIGMVVSLGIAAILEKFS